MPSRPPDVRDFTTRAARARASREASQYDLTNRVFNAALPFFGSRTRMPLIYFRPRTPGGTIDMTREPVMNTAEAYAKRVARPSGMIAYPTQSELWGREPPWRGPGQQVMRQHFMDILLHELAHTQQRPTGSHLQIEGGADAFAALARDQVARRLGFGTQAAMPFMAYYGSLGPRFVNRYGADQALYGQFGQPAPTRILPLPRSPISGPGMGAFPQFPRF